MFNLGTQLMDVPKFETRPWGEIKKGYTHFSNGDVLLAKITPCFENGKSGIPVDLPNNIGAGSTEYFVCRPLTGILNSKYLLAFFQTESFLRVGAVNMTGSVGHKRVPKEYVVDSVFSLPPLAEQIRIADKLDALLSRVDAGRERLERVPGLLKRFRQSVLSAAVSGDEVELQPLLDLVAEPLRNGKSVRDGGGGRVLRLSCLKADGVDWREAKSGDWTGLDFQKFIVYEGDFLISRGNGSLDLVGRGALAATPPEATAFPDTLIRVRPNLSTLLPAYLNLIWRTEPVRRQIQAAAKTTAGIFKVSQGDLEKIEVPIPPLSEQLEIVRRVESLFAIADRIEARYQAALTTFNRLTPALLAKAFRGKLVPQDPNDEPAAALLERIQAARAAAGEQPKRGRGAAKGAGAAAKNADGSEPKRRGRPPKAQAQTNSAAPAIVQASSYEDAVRRLEAQKLERAAGARQVGLFEEA